MARLAEDTTLPGDSTSDAFKALPRYEWTPGARRAARRCSCHHPLGEDLTLAGPASADLWIRSSTPEADIGVTLSEVRPDGKEVYIQSGVLRGSMRELGARRRRAVGRTHRLRGGRRTDAGRRVHRGPRGDLPVRARAPRRVHGSGSRCTLPAGTDHAGRTYSPTARKAPPSTWATARPRRHGWCCLSRGRSRATRRAAAMPRSAGPAVPRLRGVHQHARALITDCVRAGINPRSSCPWFAGSAALATRRGLRRPPPQRRTPCGRPWRCGP